MVDEIIFKSSRSAGELKLSDPKPPGSRYPVEYLRVSLRDRDIVASSARVYIDEPYGLAALFEDLATNRRGWEGVKEWSAVEGDFSLSCACDAHGQVAMKVTLKSGFGEDEWFVQAFFTLMPDSWRRWPRRSKNSSTWDARFDKGGGR